jgi:hypothetical protein
MNKRAEGEEYNWIFVIVAGTIILGFFVMFVFNYVQLQEKKQDVDTVRFFGGKVLGIASKLQVGSGASIDTNEQEGLRFGYNVDLTYDCDVNISKILVNQEKSVWYKLQDEILFMNNNMKINSLDLWVLPWSFPFYVTNFIYVADPKTNFYLVKDFSSNDFVDKLEVSSAFKTEKVKKENLKIKEYSKVIFFLSSKPTTSEIKKIKGYFKNVDFVFVDLTKSEVSFYEGENWGETTQFYISGNNKAQLYGSFFTDNAEDYQCNINRAMQKLKVVSKVYSEKARLLNQFQPECNHLQIANSLEDFSNGNFESVELIARQNIAGNKCSWVF